MGLGSFKSWVAAIICCWMPVDDDEFATPIANKQRYGRGEVMHMRCASDGEDQSLSMATIPTAPSAVHLPLPYGNRPVERLHLDTTTRGPIPAAGQAPSISPLSLGDSFMSISARRSNYSRRISSVPPHASRPSISAPSGFRRLDITPEQRQSLVPLRLGPVVLRETPGAPGSRTSQPGWTTSTAHSRSVSTQGPNLVDGASEEYFNGSNILRTSSRPHGLPLSPIQGSVSTDLMTPLPTPLEPSTSIQPPLSTRSSSSSFHRHAYETSISSITSKSSSERIRPKRKRSFQSFQSLRRYDEDEGADVEREILELNTIVEEHRSEGTRRANVDQQHIPAIAPAMQIRARSETLDAIGSALSRPQTARETMPLSLMNGSTTHVTDEVIPQRAKSRTRVTGWLSGLLSTAPSRTSTEETQHRSHPASTHRARNYSQSSFNMSLSSPSLTAASSPLTIKGHSRSVTGESHLIPHFSQAHIYNGLNITDSKGDLMAKAPSPTPSQVGLAF